MTYWETSRRICRPDAASQRPISSPVNPSNMDKNSGPSVNPEDGDVKDLTPPQDPVEAMGESYELLLEEALNKAHQSGALLHRLIAELRGDVAAHRKLEESDAVRLERYLKRDLVDAAQYMASTGKELKDWLGFDLALIEGKLREMFAEAADKTTNELLQLQRQAAESEYHTGEMVGLGTLACDQCQEKLHFHKPGRIPPCPRCRHTVFHRPYAG